MKTIVFFLVSFLLVKPVLAGTIFSTPLHDGGQFSVVPLFEGGIHGTGTATDGWIYYDATAGQGTFDLTATADMVGFVQIYNTNITTNTNGSLHLDGWVRFGSSDATGYQVFGDMTVGYDYEWEGDYTIFTFSPIAYAGLDQAGLFMPGGPYAGHVLDFEVISSFLAYEDNPFPQYTAVPLPAAVWLLVSGLSLLMLGGGRIRKRTVW